MFHRINVPKHDSEWRGKGEETRAEERREEMRAEE